MAHDELEYKKFENFTVSLIGMLNLHREKKIVIFSFLI
jgi:hypothetical protein